MSILPDHHSTKVQKILEINDGNICIAHKAQEMRISDMRDAIDGPGAVVIHLDDASIADLAVMCPRRLEGLAFATPSLSGE
jgi:hypothetical protein